MLHERIPLADGSGDVPVADLAAAGSLSTVPTPDHMWLTGTRPEERRGPFHFRVVHQQSLNRFLSPTAPTLLDHVVALQPGIDRVLWLEHRMVLAVGAPRLCSRGVQGAIAEALLNARLRIG